MKKKEFFFAYTIAHELKSPIITIEGFLKAILEDYGKEIPSGALEYLQHIDQAIKKLKSIINDVLTLSQISSEEQAEEFPLKDIIRDVILKMKPFIEQKKIKIEILNELPILYGKKKQIWLLMLNLISNAVKYIGKRNPCPQIQIGTKLIDGKQTVFIKDNGIGIDKDYKEKIFEIFQRSPNAKKEAEGTGVGLFVAKTIVEEHKGKIWVEPNPQKGCTFFVYIPKKRDESSQDSNN